MTPEEARALLKNTTPGPWHVDPHHPGDVLSPENHWLAGTYETSAGFTDAALIAAAPTLAAMIAGMHEEWGVVWPADKTGPEWIAWGFTTIEDAYEHTRDMTVPEGAPDVRIVRRYVTTPEEA